jgi:hypothetical protein
MSIQVPLAEGCDLQYAIPYVLVRVLPRVEFMKTLLLMEATLAAENQVSWG